MQTEPGVLGLEDAFERDQDRPVHRAVVRPHAPGFNFGLLMSLNMLIATPAGFDYTGADCAAWMQDARFCTTCGEPRVGPDSMVIGIKAG